MTLREFLQHLTLNGELDSEVTIDAPLPTNNIPGFMCSFVPTHVTQVENETVIDCRLEREDGQYVQ